MLGITKLSGNVPVNKDQSVSVENPTSWLVPKLDKIGNKQELRKIWKVIKQSVIWSKQR